MERTLVILKPNALRRGLAGEIISRFERRGFVISAMRTTVVSGPEARALYAEHEGKPFFENLISFITSGPSVLMVLSADDAVALARMMVGDKDPSNALPGTIRGDYCTTTRQNIIHASDKPASASREIALFFGGEALDG